MTSVNFIVPCFNEAENVDRFYESFKSAFDSLQSSNSPVEQDYNWSLTFVDDGSSDITWEKLTQLAATKEHVTAIRFSRNFGKEAAIYAGLKNADADYVGIIDADLQQSPADALAMCEILDKNPTVDCVAAFQEHRYEKGLMAGVKRAFYKVFSKITGMDAIENASDFRVFRKNVAQAILSMPECFRFSKGIFAWVGFETYAYPYTPANRLAGESKWSVIGLMKYAVEGMLAFSVKPLRLATVLGLFAAICAVIYFLVVFIRALVVGVEVPGYVTLMSVILLLGGCQLVCMGIIGEYLARAYLQGKERPIYIERDRVVSPELNSGSSNMIEAIER